MIAQNVDVAPPNIGPRTNAAWKAFGIYPKASGAGNPPDVYNDAFAASFIKDTGSEGLVWAGQRDDGFYVDLSRIFDLASIGDSDAAPPERDRQHSRIQLSVDRALRFPSPSSRRAARPPRAATTTPSACGRRPVDARSRFFAGTGRTSPSGPGCKCRVSGCRSSTKRSSGFKTKTSTTARPPRLISTNIGAYILNPIIVRDAAVVGILTQAQADEASGKDGPRTDIIDLINLKNIPQAGAHNIQTVGDVLRVDMGTTSVFPNGRFLPEVPGKNQETDVTDVMLSLLLLKQTSGVSDGVSKNDKDYLGEFPYLALPWQGATQGHGIIQ